MNSREQFLGRVRQAVVEGNRAGAAPDLPKRGSTGFQGAGPDPLQRFCHELKAAGGQAHVAADREAAWQIIDGVLRTHQARKVLLSRGGVVERLELPGRLRGSGLEIAVAGSLRFEPGFIEGRTAAGAEASAKPQAAMETFFAADVGISNVEYLIAETGSVVVATRPEEPRSLSLLPPVHIAIADRKQILPDLFDLFDLFSPVATPDRPPAPPPSCLTLITGPSKTGDIELKLVTGVHGPGEIHVVVCSW